MEPKLDPQARARILFDLYEFAEQAMRQSLRRRDPAASDEEIERRLLAWLHDRPGAEHGDVSGPIRVRELPE